MKNAFFIFRAYAVMLGLLTAVGFAIAFTYVLLFFIK